MESTQAQARQPLGHEDIRGERYSSRISGNVTLALCPLSDYVDLGVRAGDRHQLHSVVLMQDSRQFQLSLHSSVTCEWQVWERAMQAVPLLPVGRPSLVEAEGCEWPLVVHKVPRSGGTPGDHAILLLSGRAVSYGSSLAPTVVCLTPQQWVQANAEYTRIKELFSTVYVAKGT